MKLFKTQLENLSDQVQARFPDASNIHCIDTRNSFLRGKLFTFSYDILLPEVGKTERKSVRAYAHNDIVDFYETDDLLLSVVGETHQSINFPLSISGFIAIVLTVTICCLALWRDGPIPDILGNALTVILGFYFGQASHGTSKNQS